MINDVFEKDTFVFGNKIYPAVRISGFETADNCVIDGYRFFTSEDFIDVDDDSLLYRIIDDRMYGYLPRHLIENGTESEIREYIKENIG